MVIFNKLHNAGGEGEFGEDDDENGKNAHLNHGESEDDDEDNNNANHTHGGRKSCKTLRSIACRHLHLIALMKREIQGLQDF